VVKCHFNRQLSKFLLPQAKEGRINCLGNKEANRFHSDQLHILKSV
jgi:hypothetical protein